MSKFETDLTQGSVVKQLIRFSLPFLLSNFIQALYSVADLYIVSLFCPTGSMVGVNIGGQLALLITNLAVGLSLGGTIVIAQYAGAQKQEDMKQTISTMLSVLTFAAAVLTVGAIAASTPLLRLLNTPETSLVEARRYFNICMLGNIFVFGYNAISGILRSVGDSKRPLYFVAFSASVNVGLDLLLVMVFGMGAAGAALATIASQAMAMILAIVYLNRSKFMFSFSLGNLRIHKDKLGKILKMGLPASVQSVVISISFLIITAMTNTFGENAAAGVAAIGKINTFVILPAMAISQSVSPMTAQNIGAGRYDRAMKTMWAGVGISGVVCVIMFFIFQAFAPQFVGIFANDPLTRDEVIRFGSEYARAMTWDYLFIPFVFNMTNFAGGAGHSMASLKANMLSAIILRVPVAWLFGIHLGMGLSGLGFGIPASTIGTIIYIGSYIARGKCKEGKLGISRDAQSAD
ncbi:MAG: MATE family efflux transporter [Ruminococcaceae bacterium]|nr:MATE family efflux transporter [Oscillospiraceae bacterium]